MKALPGLSILVPAFNEEAALERVVLELLSAAPRAALEFEIIIIDDGSTDRTPAIADELARADPRISVAHHAGNEGFGAALKTGFGRAKLPFITLVPADGQFPVADLARFPPLADDADIVLGYRLNRADGLVRRFQTAVFGRLIRALLGLPYQDINWVKLYRREAVAGLDIQSRKVGVDAETLVKVLQRGGRIKEVEVGYLPRRTGIASGSRPSVIIQTIAELFKLRWATGGVK